MRSLEFAHIAHAPLLVKGQRGAFLVGEESLASFLVIFPAPLLPSFFSFQNSFIRLLKILANVLVLLLELLMPLLNFVFLLFFSNRKCHVSEEAGAAVGPRCLDQITRSRADFFF